MVKQKAISPCSENLKVNKRGFTLIEILLALLVIGIGVVSIVGVLVSTLDSSHKSRDDIHIVSFADMVLNRLHAEENWSSLSGASSFQMKDYEGNTAPIAIGPVSRFPQGTAQNARTQFTVTYQLQLTQTQNRVKALLFVWPGFSTSGERYVFQTEIYNWRKQP